MSRPSSSAESLEAILASIRRSIAEQAANELEEAPAAPEPSPGTPPVGGVAPAGSEHISGPFAGAAPDMPAGNATDLEVRPSVDAFPEEPLPAPAPDPAPPHPATTEESAAESEPDVRKAKDPLWFLGRETTQPAATPAAAFDTRPSTAANDARETPTATPDTGQSQIPSGARETPAAAPAYRTPEPKPSGRSPGPSSERSPGPSAAIALRAPRPPFFGSNVEPVKVEVDPAPPVVPRSPGPLPPDPSAPVPGAAAGPAPALNGAAARANGLDGIEITPRPAAAPQAGQPPGAAVGSESQTAGADALPQMPGLEAVVAELLRPMLREWLDENMPRLVSAALEAEIRSRRDPKKP